jgi:sugar lactone lactonase YvrE
MSWEFELVAGPFGGTAEGPVWDGEAVLFTHIPASRILRYDPRSGRPPNILLASTTSTAFASAPKATFTAVSKAVGALSASRKTARLLPRCPICWTASVITTPMTWQ